jgi:hypothetical protein
LNQHQSPEKMDNRTLHALIRQSFKYARPYSYTGVSWKDLQRYNYYKEENLELTKEDIGLTQLYAGLAVLAREVGNEAGLAQDALLKEVIGHVRQDEKSRYGDQAFPYDSPRFPYPADLDFIEKVMAGRKARAVPNLQFLQYPQIRHEWTVKVGKKLYEAFFQQIAPHFRGFACGKEGMLAQLKAGGDEVEVVKTAVIYLLSKGLVSNDLAAIVVVLVAILVRRGLKLYCKKTVSP